MERFLSGAANQDCLSVCSEQTLSSVCEDYRVLAIEMRFGKM